MPFKPRQKREFSNPADSVLIGIRFGDNDFHATWRPLLASFIDSAFVKDKGRVTKARVVKIANTLSFGFYRLYQNPWMYNLNARTAEYFEIDESHVYLGQECLDYVTNETGRHNGDFYYVDVAQRQVFSC